MDYTIEFQPTTVDLILELYMKTIYGDSHCIVIHMLSGPEPFYEDEDYKDNITEFFSKCPDLLELGKDQPADIWVFSFPTKARALEVWADIPNPGDLYCSLWIQGQVITENT